MENYHHNFPRQSSQQRDSLIDHTAQQPGYNPNILSEPEMNHSQTPLHQMSNATGLLGVYPFASVTPTSHVARHLNELSISSQASDYFHSINHDRYGDHMALLMSNDQRNAELWHTEGNHAIQLLQEQQRVESEMRIPQFATPDWQTAVPLHYDSHQTSAFAHGLLLHQHQQQYSYDNIPLANPSSSSLARALDRRIPPFASTSTPVPVPQVPQVPTPNATPTKMDSRQFFDAFLKKTHNEINSLSQRGNMGPPSSVVSISPEAERLSRSERTQEMDITPKKQRISSSPDPLFAFPPSPLKRKATTQMESPTLKRKSSSTMSLLTPLSTPSSVGTSSTIRQSDSPVKRRLTPFLIMSPRRDPHIPVPRVTDAIMASDDDLGGYSTPTSSPMKSMIFKGSVRHSTGLRDDRHPLEKFTSFLEDIFEAEDALDPSSSEVDSDFFSSNSNASAPHLSRTTLGKLIKRIQKVSNYSQARRRKSFVSGQSPLSHSIDGKGGMSHVDTMILSRLLRTLERSIRAADDADVSVFFPRQSTKEDGNDVIISPKKQKKLASLEPEVLNGLSIDKVNSLMHTLDLMGDCLMSVEASIALLSSGQLPKQIYSEDLLSTCIKAVKNTLNTLIYPLMEALAPSSLVQTHYAAALLLAILGNLDSGFKQRIEVIHNSIAAIIPLLNTLLETVNNSVSMSESIIIQMVYISIGPFFVEDPANDDGKVSKKKKLSGNILEAATSEDIFPSSAPMKGLRLNSLALLRTIFSHYPDQRSWIIEEILSSLTKLPDIKHKGSQFRLRDGRSIHIVSALLLQLIQTSAHDVRIQASKLNVARRTQKLALQRSDTSVSEARITNQEPSENDNEEIHLYTSGLDSTNKLTKGILLFLTKRSTKVKSAKSTNDAEYRAVFDNLISDLLIVLHWPEWPAASYTLNVVTRFLVGAVDDSKSNAEVNGLKSLALDHLGVIATKLRDSRNERRKLTYASWDEVLDSGNVDALKGLISTQREIFAHLSKRAGEDPAYHSARELTSALWGQRLALILKDIYQQEDTVETGGEMQTKVVQTLLHPIKEALQNVWTEYTADVFDVGSAKEISRIDQLSEQLGSLYSFPGLLDAILNVILIASDSTVVMLRTKALRALGQIVASNPETLKNPKVRRSIEGHMLDNSPAVRDASIELVGKYIIHSPDLASDYYGKVAERIADTSLAVRKRVIKLLRTLFDISQDLDRRSDICLRMAYRMLDEDDTVKDLAVRTLEELWFSDPKDDAIRWKLSGSASVSAYDVKAAFAAKISAVMSTISKLRDRQLLEDLLHAIVIPKPGRDITTIQERYSAMNDAFIDSLVDGSDQPEHSVGHCVRAIHAFTSANPSIISSSKASMLLPYLKSSQTSEELLICDHLLKIFRICVPRMPKISIKFAQDLQQALQPMVLKPTMSGGVSLLQESIACLCTVVHHLTHDYKILVGLLKSCNGRLKDYVGKDVNQLMVPTVIRGLLGIISIVALLAENCDFDKLRLEHEDLVADLNSITKSSISHHIYSIVLSFYIKLPDNGIKNRLLPCLGFLFKAYPSLMITKQSEEVMDRIFDSDDSEPRAHLLRILNSFLLSEMAKHTAAEKELQSKKIENSSVSMEELVGNTQGFADSGVSSAIVQRYLHPILQAAVSMHTAEQHPAFDIVSIVVKQGLAHPLQSMPTIISLETSADKRIASRAVALHSVLHAKHASLVNVRFLDCAKATFEYQRKISTSGQVRGYRATPDVQSLLQPWYSLVREKRPARQEFIKAMVKGFSISQETLSQSDTEFICYMAEIISSLDYKTLEEVLTVIRHLTSILSVSGVNLVDRICPASEQLRDVGEIQVSTAALTDAAPTKSEILTARACVGLGVILILKGFLKQLYNLSEEKCGKWTPGKKSTLGDKPAVKKHAKVIAWDRMPFTHSPIVNAEDVSARKKQFIFIWQEDGVSGDPVSDDELT